MQSAAFTQGDHLFRHALNGLGLGLGGLDFFTHFLDDFDFHDHIPAVFMNQRLLWFPLCKHLALFPFANGSTHFACSAYQNTAHLEPLFVIGVLHFQCNTYFLPI